MKRALYLDTECQSTLNGGSLPYEGELLDHCPSDLDLDGCRKRCFMESMWVHDHMLT